ncbi:hypothetical protein KBC31_04135 [Candidatus Saccharibacteria bacterium]|jgi:tRNA G18 (ribose-2'-O)-methylase SpoU|nr:hypothetical protein [Candidatus Saccharibacteria bacterium]
MIARNSTNTQPEIHVLLDNIRSAHNVGAIIRTAAALGVKTVWCYGLTAYPKQPDDERLPHVANRADKVIRKTALIDLPNKIAKPLTDASVHWLLQFDRIIALEQHELSRPIQSLNSTSKTLLIVGNEVVGVSDEWLERAEIYEIPMSQHKESLNVAAATAIGIYQLVKSS